MRLLVLFFLLLSYTGFAQTPILDSLQQVLHQAQTDSARVNALCELSHQHILQDAKTATEYAQKARQLALASGYRAGQIKSLHLIGYAHLVMGEYDQSLAKQLEALQLSEQYHDTTNLMHSYWELGGVYKTLKELDRANHYLHLAAALAQKQHDQKTLAGVLNTLGAVQELRKNHRQALAYYQKSAHLMEQLGNRRGLAVTLLNIGNLYQYIEHPSHGLPILFRALQVNEQIKNDMIKVPILVSIAQLYAAQKQYPQALSYAQQALEVAQQTGSSKKILSAAQLLQRLHAATGQYPQAFRYLTLFTHHDSIMDSESKKKIMAELSAKYETEKKDLENQRLKQVKEKQAREISYQQITILLFVGMLALLVLVLTLLYRSRQRIQNMYTQLEQAHRQMQIQHQEINAQSTALSLQTNLLQKQNQQLEGHNSFKNKIFSIISHDLRSPFNSLKGILNLAEKTEMGKEDVKRIFSMLDKEVNVAMNLLHNLLVWSKTQLKAETIRQQEVDLEQLTEENLQLISAAAAAKHISLQNFTPPHLCLRTDRERLNFVLRNLLVNAVKFTFLNGKIQVEAVTQEESVIISVTDNGKGISAKNMAKLFTEDRFTTLGTSKEKGTGIELMLCQEFITSLQGSLTVQSQEGQGSTFTITLPHAVISAEQPPVTALATV